MEYPPVLSKADFVRRYALGEFGNASPTWNTPDEFNLGASFRCGRRFHLRNRVAGGATFYNMCRWEIFSKWIHQPNPGDWYASEMAPHHLGTLQGEVYMGNKGLELLFTFEQLPMRDALAKWRDTRWGLVASSMLQCYLCPNSWEWLNILINRYPEHVIEFSSFRKEWGTVPGYNTVFWEVRKY